MAPTTLPTVWHTRVDKNELFCAAFAVDGAFVAVGGRDGRAHVLRADSGLEIYTLGQGDARGTAAPCTALAFRPDRSSGATVTKNVLLAANADGMVRHVHVTSGQVLATNVEEGNQIYALDCRQDGAAYATAGVDRTVRVYDEATRTLACAMAGGIGAQAAGHGNSIYAVRFHPEEPSGAVLLSGGWDSTVQVWDTRAGGAVRSMHGAYVCGDALDAFDGEVLAGAWREQDVALHLWDYGSGAPKAHVRDTPSLYAAAFGRGAHHTGLLLVGGSGRNEARLISRASGKAVGRVRGDAAAVHALAASPTEPRLAVITASGIIMADTSGCVEKARR